MSKCSKVLDSFESSLSRSSLSVTVLTLSCIVFFCFCVVFRTKHSQSISSILCCVAPVVMHFNLHHSQFHSKRRIDVQKLQTITIIVITATIIKREKKQNIRETRVEKNVNEPPTSKRIKMFAQDLCGECVVLSSARQERVNVFFSLHRMSESKRKNEWSKQHPEMKQKNKNELQREDVKKKRPPYENGQKSSHNSHPSLH